MCWASKSNKVLIAATDIPVFKVCKTICITPYKKDLSGDKVYPYYQDDSGVEYVENTTYGCEEPFHMETYYHVEINNYRVTKAIHSYSVNNIRLFASECCSPAFRIGTHKTTSQSPDVIVHSPYYCPNCVAIMLCLIPKGTRYAVNSVGEVVSDKIEVVKIIRNPFTINKDKSLSKRSVEKVNKILDNWEKGKSYVLDK